MKRRSTLFIYVALLLFLSSMPKLFAYTKKEHTPTIADEILRIDRSYYGYFNIFPFIDYAVYGYLDSILQKIIRNIQKEKILALPDDQVDRAKVRKVFSLIDTTLKTEGITHKETNFLFIDAMRNKELSSLHFIIIYRAVFEELFKVLNIDAFYLYGIETPYSYFICFAYRELDYPYSYSRPSDYHNSFDDTIRSLFVSQCWNPAQGMPLDSSYESKEQEQWNEHILSWKELIEDMCSIIMYTDDRRSIGLDSNFLTKQYFRSLKRNEIIGAYYVSIGRVLDKTRPQVKIDLYKKALYLDPFNERAYAELGKELFLEDLEQSNQEVGESLKKAISLGSQDPLVYLYYAQHLQVFQDKHYSSNRLRVLDRFAMLTGITSTHRVKAYHHLSMIIYKLLEKTLELDPSQSYVRELRDDYLKNCVSSPGGSFVVCFKRYIPTSLD